MTGRRHRRRPLAAHHRLAVGVPPFDVEPELGVAVRTDQPPVVGEILGQHRLQVVSGPGPGRLPTGGAVGPPPGDLADRSGLGVAAVDRA